MVFLLLKLYFYVFLHCYQNFQHFLKFHLYLIFKWTYIEKSLCKQAFFILYSCIKIHNTIYKLNFIIYSSLTLVVDVR